MKKAGFMEKNQIQDKERRIRTVADSRTEQVHLIMHQHLNAAMRHAGTNRVTTAAIDNLQFKEATYEGELLVLIGYVTCVGNTSMEVEIDTYVERSDGMRYSVNRAFFVMVAMDENEHPMQVPGLKICTEAEKGRHEAGLLRKNMRKNRMKTGF